MPGQLLSGRLLYLYAFAFYAMSVLSFVMWKLVPSYVRTFEDFDARLPEATIALMSVSDVLTTYGLFLTPLLLVAVASFFYVMLRYSGWIREPMPGFGWIVRRLDTAAILESLALAARRSYPIQRAVGILADLYHKPSIRRRLVEVRREVDAGADWCESLLRHRLIKRADFAVLTAATRVGNLPWALREMADSNRRRLAYRLHAAVQVCYPPVILALGAVVMFIVVSLFLPVISLIEQLTPK